MLLSFAIHIVAVVLLILFAQSPLNPIPVASKQQRRNPIFLQPVPSPKGGGGSLSPTAPSRGRLPRFAHRQFAPPTVIVMNTAPKLMVEPTIVLASNAELRHLEGPIGLPNGVTGPPSGGPGGPGGIGTGGRNGIGGGEGPGIDGIAAVPLRGDMVAPVVLYKLEPEYSEQARKARIQGTVVLEGVIDERGRTHMLKVRDGLGLGLDEQAIEAVKQWRFKPATKDGKPIAIVGTFYLTFRLL